ncbi:putative repressor protein [Escherichia coli VL2732]|nr:putative repressor protein [Escherichia coli VL2732]
MSYAELFHSGSSQFIPFHFHTLIITLCTKTIHAQDVFFVCILKVHIVLLFHGYYGGHMSNLRKYRESLNISQTTLAKAVGCTQGATADKVKGIYVRP